MRGTHEYAIKSVIKVLQRLKDLIEFNTFIFNVNLYIYYLLSILEILPSDLIFVCPVVPYRSEIATVAMKTVTVACDTLTSQRECSPMQCGV